MGRSQVARWVSTVPRSAGRACSSSLFATASDAFASHSRRLRRIVEAVAFAPLSHLVRASMTLRFLPSLALLLTVSLSAQVALPPAESKTLTLDAFMAETEYTSARLSPDGTAAVVATREPDW